VGSRKARTLLALLAVERGRLVTADRIVGVLWPADRPKYAARNLATLVSRLRAALGTEVVLGGRAGYRLGDTVRGDLHEAAALLSEAESRLAGDEPSLALVAAHRVVELLATGEVLADEPDAPWATPARNRQRDLLRRGWHVAADSALRIGDLRAARAAGEAAAAADSLDEVAVRALMRAYDAGGEPARALIRYEGLRARLAGELGVDPAPATRDLHVAILRGTVAPNADAVRPTVAVRAAAGDGRPVVGRTRELARLAAGWAAAAAGEVRLLLIVGETGVGKTLLADETVELARGTGAAVAYARCYPAERTLFLQPVVDALAKLVAGLAPAELARAAGDRAGALAALLPDVAVLGAAPLATGYRRQAYDAVATFLRRLSGPRPLLLVLDDLHNADMSTVELLHYLCRHAPGGRLLIVATVRVEDGDAVLATLCGVADRVDVGPLDTGAIARLAAAAGQEARVGEIERRTRGHPLFVVELLRRLVAGDTEVPEPVRSSVLDRVRRAGSGAEEVLRAAAVLGPSFTPVAVADLLGIGVPEAARRCERLLPSRLTVVAGHAYEFANDLVHEVLYGTTPVPTRSAYHSRIADLLADDPEAVGRHAEAAEDWPRAARAWLAAGEQKLWRYAAGEAEAFLDRALAAAKEAGDAELEHRARLARGMARGESILP
jgi:DNA-binding SARP family transcriptional activator